MKKKVIVILIIVVMVGGLILKKNSAAPKTIPESNEQNVVVGKINNRNQRRNLSSWNLYL